MKTDCLLSTILLSVATTLLLISATGCNDNILLEKPEQTAFTGESITVTGSLSIPKMLTTATRSAFEQGVGQTAGSGLKLTVFEFDMGSDASNSFLSNIYQAEINEGEDTNVGNNETVNFSFVLKAASTPKVLHFFVHEDYQTSMFGSVATILPTLTAGYCDIDYFTGLIEDFEEQEGYWGYVELHDGYVKKGADGSPLLNSDGNMVLLDGENGVQSKLKNIPMIRNFAQISVEVAPSAANNFELLGFDIINVPTSGSIAPWDQNILDVPDLLDGNVMKSYSTITRDGYEGFLPSEAQFRNVEAEARKWSAESENMKSTASRFMYEHPYEESRRSYLIVHGIFTEKVPATGAEKKTDCFYKVDIGNPDPENHDLFQPYNIIRNIHYKVKINQVNAKGALSVSAAIDHPPYNNLSTATETESMRNISDGTNMLIVNNTNYVIVQDNQTIDVLYQYKTNINTDSPSIQNGIPHVVLGQGNVIKEMAEPIDSIQNGVAWKVVKLKINNPTDIVETQSLTIVDDSGLGRTINFVLHDPWPYTPIYQEDGIDYYATVAEGTNNHYDYNDPYPETISSARGTELTVYFNLPSGMPQSMFPLTFKIESKKQWIENNKIGTLVVSTGPSLFDSTVTAISFIKTVSYEEYLYNYYEDNDKPNELDVNSPNTLHTIRCRFLTIGDEEGEAEIGIYNPYFTPTLNIVRFERGAGEMN